MPHNEVLKVCKIKFFAPPKVSEKTGKPVRVGGTSMYAIIETGGKQYKVSEGDYVKIEKLDAEAGATVTFDKVIAVGGKKLIVGADVANASVSGTVLEQGRGRKIIVYKYKSKTGYHKKQGHRQAYTKVKIDKINA